MLNNFRKSKLLENYLMFEVETKYNVKQTSVELWPSGKASFS